MDRIVIAVDGLAGSGKTALSKALAQKLGFVYLSTGILYRAVGYLVLQEGNDFDDGAAIANLVQNHTIELGLDADSRAVLRIDGKDVISKLYAPEASEASSKAAQHPEVRAELVKIQRSAFSGRNLVVEGRDIGTVIFPDALAKFYVVADEHVRLERRLKQLVADLGVTDPEELKLLKEKMKIEILERDQRDLLRNVSPAIQADDAILIDNSSQTLTKVVENMYDAVAKRRAL
ncbi:(d)CMP kinase [Oligoflexia bacterium]|nr:(d)CMP kinase [Oligoflexia bacterium]